MKTLGVLVIMALVVGAFTSIPNVSAIGVYGDADFTKAQGTSHLTFGSASGKVCGIELCGSKSMPSIKETKVEITTGNGDAKSEALNRALQGQEASVIIREYNDFKGITIVENINSTEEIVTSDFNAFANPDFLNPKSTTSVMKIPDEMTIEEKKQAQVDAVKANFPGYIRESYANVDHPVYVPKVTPVIVENTNSSEIILEQNNVNRNMTDFSADLILFEMGFDIDMSKIGVCGPGTELIDGICFIAQIDETITNDWSDFWDTKEDKEVVLEQVIMTNGTEAIPLVDNTMQVPAPGFEDVEEMVVEPVVVEEVKQEIILETMTIVVDGKTFKDQASADRYLALTGKTIAPVVEPIIEVPIVEEIIEPEVNPRLDTTNSTESTPTHDNAGGGSGGEAPPPFQP